MSTANFNSLKTINQSPQTMNQRQQAINHIPQAIITKIQQPGDNNSDSCGTCRYFDDAQVDVEHGSATAFCRRNPPFLVRHVGADEIPDSSHFSYAKTAAHEWCGEHKQGKLPTC